MTILEIPIEIRISAHINVLADVAEKFDNCNPCILKIERKMLIKKILSMVDQAKKDLKMDRWMHMYVLNQLGIPVL
jgi:hypothetical protein